MKERYGVTGSHGFLGEHLVSRLDEPRRMDRSGFVPYDVQGVFDLAAYGNMADHKDMLRTYEANVMRLVEMSKNLAKESTESDFLIFVSTSSVTLPQQTYYSASKKAAEEFLQVFSKENDYPVAIVRPYSLIGPGEQPNHLIPKLIESAIEQKPMPFVATPVHDFIDVRDFVDALITVKDNITDMRGQIFNVGTGVQRSNQEVLETVEKVTGKKCIINHIDSMRSYDSTSWVSDNTAISSLGWEPKISFEQSIASMVEEYERKNS